MTVIESSSAPTIEHDDVAVAHPVVRLAFAAFVMSAAGLVLALCLMQA